RYSGSYYVTESRHLFYQGIYTTEFSVRGLRGENLLQTLSPSTRLRPGQTHLVGIVTDNKDPKGWGRVRVKFPTLTPEKNSTAHASYWARVVGVGAGPGRGFDCLPEINDEVLVAFEHGDIHRPYIIGGVWNGKDQPPANITDSVDKGKVRLRTFKTRTQHTLQFVEEDKGGTAAGIYIQTSQGHEIRLNDSNGSIEVRTKGGQSIRLDDQGGITIGSRGNIQLQPGTGQVLVSGNVLATQLLVGTTVSNINVGETLTNLQQQIQQNTNSDRTRSQEMAQLKEQVQQNISTDIQQAETLSSLQEKITASSSSNQVSP
ncbi:MAG: phage baseplate assembly protein V, partial [Planktothrix sp.]